jgi:tRNA A37 threonylcarbamoyladenosine biosynthesis protein TsaE
LSAADNISFFLELTINNLNVIEWPEKNFQFWQDKNCICLTFRIIDRQQTRKIEVNFFNNKNSF